MENFVKMFGLDCLPASVPEQDMDDAERLMYVTSYLAYLESTFDAWVASSDLHPDMAFLSDDIVMLVDERDRLIAAIRNSK